MTQPIYFGMARQARFILPDQPCHVVQRGNDRQPIFHADADRQQYLGLLHLLAQDKHVAIHAYVLMTNHVHLLLTPPEAGNLSAMMKALAGRYAGWFNAKYGRSGTLWEGRFRSSLVQADAHFLACMRYIELNPVRAGIVTTPDAYPWSSYRHHAGIEHSTIVSDHTLFWSLGNTPFDREAAYRELVSFGMSAAEHEEITRAWKSSHPYGSADYKHTLAETTGRQTTAMKSGRPRHSLSVPN
jgi:putative transposase